MSDDDPKAATSRLRCARKQLRLALQDVDDHAASASIRMALDATHDALDDLGEPAVLDESNQAHPPITDGGPSFRRASELYDEGAPRHTSPKWISEGGEGLPPSANKKRNLEEDIDVWLFTCCSCGRRLADPPGPPADMECRCGGDYTCHRFDQAEYSRIRWYGDPRLPDEDGDRDG